MIGQLHKKKCSKNQVNIQKIWYYSDFEIKNQQRKRQKLLKTSPQVKIQTLERQFNKPTGMEKLKKATFQKIFGRKLRAFAICSAKLTIWF